LEYSGIINDSNVKIGMLIKITSSTVILLRGWIGGNTRREENKREYDTL
jgi:hypothetical protein